MMQEKICDKRPNLHRNISIRANLKNNILNFKAEWVDTKKMQPAEGEYNCIDLFSGAGGISCGLKMAGINPIFAVEIDPIACETYKRNFPKASLYCGDIKTLEDEKIKKIIGEKTIHILTGGFPCQGFSVAGYRDPNDKRNVLYKEIVRVVKLLNPWFVILENVPGIITMKKGEVYKTIIKDFNDIGYPNMSVHVLESADYGVAQLRPRAIFIANKFNVKNPFPKSQLKPIEYKSIESSIDDLKNKERDPSINHEWTEHSKKIAEKIKQIKPGESLYETFFDAYKRQYRGVPAMTIKENHGGTHIHYELDRCISAREMARIQSFPDSFLFSGTMKKAMWQIGNAVPPLLFKNIGLGVVQKLRKINSDVS